MYIRVIVFLKWRNMKRYSEYKVFVSELTWIYIYQREDTTALHLATIIPSCINFTIFCEFAYVGNCLHCAISISVEPGPAVSSFVDVVLECCKMTVVLKPVNEHHISLTRTVVLRHHWIDSFLESVRLCIKELPRSDLAILMCFTEIIFGQY